MPLPIPRFMARASQRRAHEAHENARDPGRAERHRLFLDMHRQNDHEHTDETLLPMWRSDLCGEVAKMLYRMAQRVARKRRAKLKRRRGW